LAITLYQLIVCLVVSGKGGDSDPIVEKLQSQEAVVREEGRRALLSIAREDPPRLERYLTHNAWQVRRCAVEALATIPGAEATRRLVEVVLGEADPSVEVVARIGLQGRERDVTPDQLRKMLEAVRQEPIAEALRIMQHAYVDESMLVPLSRLLGKEYSYAIRSQACVILSKAEDISIPMDKRIDALLSALKRECENPTAEPNVGHWACPMTENVKGLYRGAILRIAQRQQGRDPSKNFVVAYLRSRLEKEGQGEFRKNLVLTLGYLGDPNVYGEIVKLATTDKNLWCRRDAIGALGEIGNKDAIPLLSEALQDPCSVTRDDIKGPAGYEQWGVIYPIRDAAFSSLVKLGVKVRSEAPGSYKIVSQ